MKNVRTFRAFDFWHPNGHACTHFEADQIYDNVPEAAARALVKAGAGEVIPGGKTVKEDSD